MKKLQQFIVEGLSDRRIDNLLESNTSTRDYINVKHRYAQNVISKLINKESIRLGKKGDEGTYTANDNEIEKLKSFQFDYTRDNLQEFNKIFNGHIVWSDIFKGDFSGYVNGLPSKNRGNAFEEEFILNFRDKYQGEIEKILNLNPGDLDQYSVVPCGSFNTHRPLTNKDDLVFLDFSKNNNNKTIGDAVADVRLKNDHDNINLSLKCNNTVSFCSAGILKFFSRKTFEEYKRTGEYIPDKFGQTILNLLCIDNDKFAQVFTNYDPLKTKKFVRNRTRIEPIDVTKDINKQNLKYFIDSVIGYNYILVHKIGKDIHCINLMSPKDRDNFIGNIDSVKIYYGGKTGAGARVDVELKLSSLLLTFVIRDKSGRNSGYPTHINGDYKIL